MKDLASNILIGAFIGSLFTIITNRVLEKIKRDRIKKTINYWLLETIKPITFELKKELNVVSQAIDNYYSEGISLGMHPTFNSSVLKSFTMTDLNIIYNIKFSEIINIIGYIDNLGSRLPYICFKNCTEEMENHLNEHFEKHKDSVESKLKHFTICHTLILKRNLVKANLKNVEAIINDLETHIDSVINNQKK
jgi:hypothetical protein